MSGIPEVAPHGSTPRRRSLQRSYPAPSSTFCQSCWFRRDLVRHASSDSSDSLSCRSFLFVGKSQSSYRPRSFLPPSSPGVPLIVIIPRLMLFPHIPERAVAYLSFFLSFFTFLRSFFMVGQFIQRCSTQRHGVLRLSRDFALSYSNSPSTPVALNHATARILSRHQPMSRDPIVHLRHFSMSLCFYTAGARVSVFSH